MSRRSLIIVIAAVLLVLCLSVFAVGYFFVSRQVDLTAFTSDADIAAVELPPGFEAAIFAEGLSGPRFLAFGPDGVLHVADRGNNRIVTLPDTDGNGRADSTNVFADNLNSPHSLVFHEGAWFVGVPSGVVRLQDTNGDGRADVQETVVGDLPPSGQHTTRTVDFLPDGRMVISVGSSCNVCEEEDPRRAAIVVYEGPAGGGEEIFATGLRNAVGLAVHPQTGELWATNNGRDLMGDDLPPETIYQVTQGSDYGWPTCHAGDIVDPDMGQPGSCDGVPAPDVAMQAHMAPLGLTFYTGDSFPADYQGDMFVALHGSWNRSVPVGYKVGRVPMENGRPAGDLQDFATGWLDLEANAVYGRPVDVAVGPDGALYVSDDKGGYIYRIQYTGR